MFWYEIRTFPGYRIDQFGEVLSLLGGEPRVMKVWNHRVTLRQDGRSVARTIPELLALGGIQVPQRSCPHPEAARPCCDQGHEFTPANTMKRKNRKGEIVRKCKECHRLAMARYRARKKAGLV